MRRTQKLKEIMWDLGQGFFLLVGCLGVVGGLLFPQVQYAALLGYVLIILATSMTCLLYYLPWKEESTSVSDASSCGSTGGEKK